MDFNAVGVDVHLIGTVWRNQENGETYVLPLDGEFEMDVSAAQVLYFNEIDTLNLINRAWLVESKRFMGLHAQEVKSALARMERQIDSKLMWKVFRRDGFKCVYCGNEEGQMTYDHFIPQSQGGPTNMENGRCCCRPCNQDKGSLSPEEWLASAALKKRIAWISKLKAKQHEHESKSAKVKSTAVL